MRTPIIAGNWKMNPPTVSEARELALAVRAATIEVRGVEVVICPPALWLGEVARAVRDGPVRIGAQTMHFDEAGAYTGEISPSMLAGLAEFVIIGHSERRQHDGETDEKVGRKVAAAVAHGLRPIAAIGERAEERHAAQTAAVIERQLRAAVAALHRLVGTGLVIAYEPVWAIGTGEAASPEDAQQVAAQIRAILRAVDAPGAAEVPIQYGGSVSAANAGAFFAQPDIDGALVGGSSLKPDEFGAIIRAAGGSTA